MVKKEVVIDQMGKVLENGAGAMLIFNMLDELAYELGYVKGAQDLIGEEPCVNVELLQIVYERLESQRILHESAEAALRAKIRKEIEAEMRADPMFG